MRADQGVGEGCEACGADPLTGVLTRQKFTSDLAEHICKDRANDVLCFLDIDNFRFLNAEAGIKVGDLALKGISALLQKNLMPHCLIGRMGDDEFALLLTATSLTEAQEEIGGILNAILAYQLEWSGKSFQFSACAGLALVLQSDTAECCINRAASACSIAKSQDRGSVAVADQQETPWVAYHNDARILSGLQAAISDNRLRLYAQEIVNFAPDCDSSLEFELLVHMIDTEGKEFSPAAIIPAAERYGFIRALDRWVIKAVLVDCASMLLRNPKIALSLNLSGQSLGDPTLWPYVAALFKQSGMAASRIQFEITETSAIRDMAVALEFVKSARAYGCKIALDDFGSGLSSFAYLRNFPVDCIKIDGAFISNVAEPASVDRATVNAIVGVARALGLTVVAEHVDNAEVLGILRRLGVDRIQGFLLSQPTPFREMLEKKLD